MNPPPISPVDRFFVIFTSIVYEALPFIILGALISGVLEELLPQSWLARAIPRKRWLAIAGSALLGMIFPMCECGIVPVMRRLLGKGLPLSCAVAYMLAAPVINPVVIASTWAAFSGDRSSLDGLSSGTMVFLRVTTAYLTAFVVASIVDRLERRRGIAALVRPIHGAHHHHAHSHENTHADSATTLEAKQTPLACGHDHEHGPDCAHHGEHAEKPSDHGHEPAKPLISLPISTVHDATATPELERKTVLQRLISISETSLRDFIDITGFLILGAILAGIVQTFQITEDYAPVLSQNPVLAAPAMMVLAILLCLCSEADAFVAANLLQIPLSGKLAFLVLGPMLDLKLYMMYTRVFRNRLIWTIIPSVITCVFVLSIAAHYIFWAIRGTSP